MKTIKIIIAALLMAQAAVAQEMPHNIHQLKNFGCELADSSLLKKVIKKHQKAVKVIVINLVLLLKRRLHHLNNHRQ